MGSHSSINMPCPLGRLDEVYRRGLKFYFDRRLEVRSTAWPKQRPSFEQLEAIREGQFFDMLIDGERWRRVPLNVTWTLAPDDANYRCEDPMARPKPGPRHIHCSFEFLELPIHIDFANFSWGGPVGGLAEFLFFVNGRLCARGGYYHVGYFTTHSYGQPACLRAHTYAIIAEDRFSRDAVLPPFTGLSAWLIGPRT
jgi:hypothetical protein